MKTQPNDPIDNVIDLNTGVTVCHGLTKREHMSIEFFKALMSNGHHGYEGSQMVTLAIQAADLLISKLNAEQQ